MKLTNIIGCLWLRLSKIVLPVRLGLVVASAGTVDTAAVYPLQAISDLCRRYGASLHVDWSL